MLKEEKQEYMDAIKDMMSVVGMEGNYLPNNPTRKELEDEITNLNESLNCCAEDEYAFLRVQKKTWRFLLNKEMVMDVEETKEELAEAVSNKWDEDIKYYSLYLKCLEEASEEQHAPKEVQ